MATESTFPHLPLKDALALIPTFNGTNMPVSEFITKVECAKQAVLARELNLFSTLIRTKIEGDASKYIESDNPDSLRDLLDCLKQAYASKQHLPDIQLDLAQSAQRRNESVLDYGARIKHLLRQACESIDASESISDAQVLKKNIKETARLRFMKGLLDELEIRVAHENPQTLQMAIDTATKTEKLLSDRLKLASYRDTNYETQNHIKCSICKLTDHIDKYCPEQPSVLVVCRYCKKAGHSIEECRTRQRNNTTCTQCGRKGHSNDKCRSNRSQYPQNPNIHQNSRVFQNNTNRQQQNNPNTQYRARDPTNQPLDQTRNDSQRSQQYNTPNPSQSNFRVNYVTQDYSNENYDAGVHPEVSYEAEQHREYSGNASHLNEFRDGRADASTSLEPEQRPNQTSAPYK